MARYNENDENSLPFYARENGKFGSACEEDDYSETADAYTDFEEDLYFEWE